MILTPIIDVFKKRIRYRITAVAALPALLFLSILGGGVYWQMYTNAYDQLVASIELNAKNHTQRLGATLNTIETTLQTLSENSTIANGLIDSAGRETYLAPLLEGFSVIDGIRIDIGLIDFLGETIAFSGQVNPFAPYKDNVALVIDNGKSVHKIISKDGQRFLFGIDVLVYSRTGSGEGALVYLVNIDKIFELHKNNNTLFEMKLFQDGVDRPQNTKPSLFQRTTDKIILTHSVPVTEELSNLGLTIETMTDAKKAFEPLQQLSGLFLIGCGVVVFLVLTLSLWLGRQLTRPLQQLKTIVDNASLDAAIPLDELMARPDELGSLASSFNKIFTNLQNLNLTLEEKVQEQTREHVLAKNEAERANMAKSEFLSAMSHELRTPLNAILGFAQVLALSPKAPLSKGQMAATKQIMDGGYHLLDLIDDVLNLARIETGRMDLSIEPINTQVVVDECITISETLTYDLDVTLDIEDFTGSIILADRIRFKQVLLNLMSNAIKYNHNGGCVRVSSNITKEGQYRISVADTGRGIPIENQSELFKPFSRLGAENSDIEGTGIGLTITQRIVEAMEGNIGFESTEGVGSTFWIELPLAAVQQSNTPETLRMGEQHQISSTSRGKILYIEDNPANVSLMSSILENLSDIELETAHTAEIGISLARREPPNLILMDINLPGMNGIEALSTLKSYDETRNIPVIAISADAMPSQVQKGLNAGFMTYLTKPINISELVDQITKVISEKAK